MSLVSSFQASNKNSLNKAFMLNCQKISDLLCYVCGENNPQFSDILFDGRSVDYCGSCLELVQDSKGVLS